MFVKPAREGTGMGMDNGAICHNADELHARVRWVISQYKQPALVEEYLSGREYTVGILGRQGFPQYSLHPEYYQQDGFHRMPVLEVDHSHCVTPGVYGIDAKSLNYGEAGIPEFICPADISPEFSQKLQELAIRGHNAIGALDVSRIDFRCDAEGNPFLLEINTLPGLSPGFSDLCVIAGAEGISYRQLILEILYLGASRYGLIEKSADHPEPIALPESVQRVRSQRPMFRHPAPAQRPLLQ
jgi:D-alanine-D-alanine ligase